MNKDYNGYHGLYIDGRNLYNSSLKIWYRLQDVFTSGKKVYKKEVSSVRLQNKSIDWINIFVILALNKVIHTILKRKIEKYEISILLIGDETVGEQYQRTIQHYIEMKKASIFRKSLYIYHWDMSMKTKGYISVFSWKEHLFNLLIHAHSFRPHLPPKHTPPS